MVSGIGNSFSLYHRSIPETWFLGITAFAVKDVDRAIADRNTWREEDKGDCILRGRRSLAIHANKIDLIFQLDPAHYLQLNEAQLLHLFDRLEV